VSAAVRKERISEKKRKAIARKANRERWRKHREERRALRKQPPPLPTLTTRVPFVIEKQR
jgi:hypothetical protein